jgi:hypothetical protein
LLKFPINRSKAWFLPDWLFAYSYPQECKQRQDPDARITDEHNRVLPQPLFPTAIVRNHHLYIVIPVYVDDQALNKNPDADVRHLPGIEWPGTFCG